MDQLCQYSRRRAQGESQRRTCRSVACQTILAPDFPRRTRAIAIDPATPAGDRLVGSTVLPNTQEVDQGMVKAFLERLRAAGVEPAEVITDDARLYPAALAEVWPTAIHQVGVLHATRRVVRAVSEVIKHVRRALPTPPPASKPTLLGTLRRTPPAADQHDPGSERYRWRLGRRTLGIA